MKPVHDRRSCIMIFNLGGPSHIDLWDPKPEASSEIRGTFAPVGTDVHGLRILDPPALETAINGIAGVVTVGLFAHRRADVVIIGGPTGIRRLE